MTSQELKKKVISSMKKDDELKKYVNDLESLSNENFDILIKIMNKAYFNGSELSSKFVTSTVNLKVKNK